MKVRFRMQCRSPAKPCVTSFRRLNSPTLTASSSAPSRCSTACNDSPMTRRIFTSMIVENMLGNSSRLACRCFSCIGRNHGVQVHAIVTELLDLEPVFEPQERPIDDVFCELTFIVNIERKSNQPKKINLKKNFSVRRCFEKW